MADNHAEDSTGGGYDFKATHQVKAHNFNDNEDEHNPFNTATTKASKRQHSSRSKKPSKQTQQKPRTKLVLNTTSKLTKTGKKGSTATNAHQIHQHQNEEEEEEGEEQETTTHNLSLDSNFPYHPAYGTKTKHRQALREAAAGLKRPRKPIVRKAATSTPVTKSRKPRIPSPYPRCQWCFQAGKGCSRVKGDGKKCDVCEKAKVPRECVPYEVDVERLRLRAEKEKAKKEAEEKEGEDGEGEAEDEGEEDDDGDDEGDEE